MSSSGDGGVTLDLTLVINKEKTKVLFASVDGAFADVLLSFLTLPLGGILKLLDNHYGADKAPTIGSLTTLYNGLQSLDSVYFCTEAGKQMLLNPRSSLEDECSKLKISVYGTQPVKFFGCTCLKPNATVSLYHAGANCTNCGSLMNKEIKVEGLGSLAAVTNVEVFTKQVASFIVSDDLRMLPNVTASVIQNLKNLGIMDMRGAETKIVTVGFNEMMDLLKLSLISRCPLADLFIHNGEVHHSATAKSQLLSSLPVEAKSSSIKMKIKAMMQKSTNKLVFAQAGDDFVEFLFSFLTIPLGQVECLLDMNSSLGSIDSLYSSVSNVNGAVCLKNDGTKENLLKPKLPPKYLSNRSIFPLQEQLTPYPSIYYHYSITPMYQYSNWTTSIPLSSKGYSTCTASFVDPKGEGCYMKGSVTFMVMDDLTVMPLLVPTSISTLVGMEIPLTDIEELEIDVGIEEALSILKASLTSTSALTDGLKLNTATMKQPKQER